MASHLEIEFSNLWDSLHPEIPLETEYIGIPGRRFRFDFANPESKVAIEINGGVWNPRMGHSTGRGLIKDYEKSNLAQCSGWIVFSLASSMINREWLTKIADAINRRYGNTRI